MLSWLLSIRLIAGPVSVIVDILGLGAALAILVTRRWRRWYPIAAAAIVGGFGCGLLLCWILGDLLNLFDVTLSVASRVWFSVGVAGLFLAIARLVFSRGRLAGAWVAAALVLFLVGALGLNADLAEFPTVGNALGVVPYGGLRLPRLGDATGLDGWKAPADLPADGAVGRVVIPGTTSRFRARDAIVYLPPAARVADPPALPVLELMSGQPGEPDDLFAKGALATILDTIARRHHGLAPIVVVPDQLGSASSNPMCVNSPLGDAQTYLTIDVPRWIHAHLNVLSGASSWGVGGFSEGGTCAIQFGAARPRLFGTILDISGQVAPKAGTVQQTIDAGFGGSTKAYEAAIPANIMKRVGPYRHTLALFSVGQLDARYGPGLATVAAAAKAAGMTTRLDPSPGTAHDWHTVQFAFDALLPIVERHWGLDD